MKPQVWEAAIEIARRVGYRNITRQLLADKLGCNLNWVHNNCRISELTEKLREQATVLGLEEGDRGGAPSGPGRNWSEKDRQEIFDAAWAIAEENGLGRCTRDAVAIRASVAPSTINLRWENIRVLRKAIAARAAEIGHSSLTTQAQALGII